MAFSKTSNQIDILCIGDMEIRHLRHPCYSLLVHPLLTFQVDHKTSEVYVRGALSDYQPEKYAGDRNGLNCNVESKVQ